MPEPDQTSPLPPPPPQALPWEAPGAGLGEYFLTLYGILLRPSWALSAPPAGNWPRWTGFAFILWLLVFLAHYLLALAWGSAGGLDLLALGLMGLVLQAAVALPLYAGVVLLTLNLLARGQRAYPFALVFRAMCYSQVSTVAILLPVVGIYLHIVWNLALMALGLRLSLGLPWRNALLGATLPLLGFFLLGVMMAGLLLRAAA